MIDNVEINVDTVIIVDAYGVDEEYNKKTHPEMSAELVVAQTGSELVIRIPIEPGSSPQTRQAPRG
jgi:hypothetical protein